MFVDSLLDGFGPIVVMASLVDVGTRRSFGPEDPGFRDEGFFIVVTMFPAPSFSFRLIKGYVGTPDVSLLTLEVNLDRLRRAISHMMVSNVLTTKIAGLGHRCLE